MDAAEYRRVIGRVRQVYQESRTAVAELNPPPSLANLNDTYLSAIDYYVNATKTLEKAADGEFRYLTDAIPDLRAGNQRARDTALALWADEYVPN